MDSSFSATSRKSHDLPKPETGLAEWTNKIKALQKEVDADEEAEQKRLEEEIAAARQARLRRSRGNSASSRVNSADIPTDKEQLNFSSKADDPSANDDPRSAAERVNNQETALHKLMGRNDVYNPNKLPASTRAPTGKTDAISLAAFIGGTATGPRLNRHAPQQDAHDPTQFIQPDLSAPHPIFGRGGVAMPGMGSKGTKIPPADVGSEHSERYRPSTLTSTKSMSSLTNVNKETSSKESIDVHGRSFTTTSKPVSILTAQKQEGKDESSQGKSSYVNPRNQHSSSYSPRPLSSAKSSSYLTKNEEPTLRDTNSPSGKSADNFRSSHNLLSSTPKPISSPVSTPSRTWSTSPTKFTNTSSAQSNLNSTSKNSTTSNLPSYLPQKEDAAKRVPFPLPTKSTDKDMFRSNQNAFSSTPKSAILSSSTSYLPKKEDTVVRSSSPTKSVDTFRTTPIITPRFSPSGNSSPNTNSNAVGKVATSTLSSADTPLRRLMESNNVYNPDKISTADPTRKSVAERAQTVSLAAFMGGNGAGIRLNRHAPQQDAHDPTQFVQYDTSVPHPIFGRGGIAMPGMTVRNATKSSDTPGSENSERYRPSGSTRPTWPPASSSMVDKGQERPISPQKTGNRERTTSAPSSQVPNTLTSSSVWSSSNKLAGRQSPTKEVRALAPARDRTISGPSYINNHTTFISPSTSLSSSQSASSLSRPIQPIPKSSSSSPHISGTTTTSPAFQKPAAQKDLTPSISRLQGRGFVQNMVKASAQIEALPSPSPSDKLRPVSAGGRIGSVLDRWQPNAQSSSPTKPSFPPFPTKKSTTHETHESPQGRLQATKSSTPTDAPHTIKSVASLPSLANPTTTSSLRLTQELPDVIEQYSRPRTPGLGSATTMVLIKPTKSSSDLTQLSHVDELGIKHDPWRISQMDSNQNASTEIPPSSKKPLIHPTKGRARKPRKHSDSHSVITNEPSPTASQKRLLEDRDLIQSQPQTQTLKDDSVFLQEQRNRSFLLNNSANLHNEQTRAEVLLPSTFTLATKHTQPDNTSNDQIPSLRPVGVKDESVLEIPSLRVEPFTPKVSVSSSPSSPVKHTRIPSTGNRATVMEVAQALLENPPHGPVPQDTSPNQPKPVMDREPLSPTAESIPKPRPLSQIQVEKRKSSYEKYSAIILPPLKEEATPTPSPAGTLTLIDIKVVGHEHAKPGAELDDNLLNDKPTLHELKSFSYLEFDEIPLPDIDFSRFIKQITRPSMTSSDAQTVSVEILALTGTTATPLTRALDIFYETEILVIIHRTKSKSSGLASTSVWCWLGRQSILGDREGRKLQELAKRYGTTAKIIHQLAEPAEVIEVLGGRLAIRQGTRTHWSSENTTMHLVRSLHGKIMIDEYNLNVHNLCSAFSYCFTLLGSVYVWHGRGSTQQERDAALKYVETFSNDVVSPIVLLEGEDDNDDMFWMILGDQDFAKADYWQWRNTSPFIDPAVWRIDVESNSHPLLLVPFISTERELQKSIYIINCIWEFYIVVGKEVRSDRRAIKFTLDLVTKLSMEASSSRPYVPTVHVLILPSQIPLDLRLGIRDLDEAWMNDGEIPDHMNLIHSSEAVNHLSTYSWDEAALKDHTMLPLGINVSLFQT